MDTLFDLFTSLNTDPFQRLSPTGDGLPPEAREALLRWRRGEAPPSPAPGGFHCATVCFDPGDDPLPDPDVSEFPS